MRLRRYLLALVAGCLFITTPADANIVGEPMTDPVALHEVRMGVAWWSQHGYTGCPNGLSVRVEDDTALRHDPLLDVPLKADDQVFAVSTVIAPGVGGCETWLARSVYDIYTTNRRFEELDRTCRRRSGRYYCDDRSTVRVMREYQAERCGIVRHELGHSIAGLDDDQVTGDQDVDQVMEQTGWVVMFDDCEALAAVTWRYRPGRTSRENRVRYSARLVSSSVADNDY